MNPILGPRSLREEYKEEDEGEEEEWKERLLGQQELTNEWE